jgi:hypothetical protein
MNKSKININSIIAIAIIAIFFQIINANAQEPWKANQLLSPADLNKILNDPKLPQPVIIVSVTRL